MKNLVFFFRIFSFRYFTNISAFTLKRNIRLVCIKHSFNFNEEIRIYQ